MKKKGIFARGKHGKTVSENTQAGHARKRKQNDYSYELNDEDFAFHDREVGTLGNTLSKKLDAIQGMQFPAGPKKRNSRKRKSDDPTPLDIAVQRQGGPSAGSRVSSYQDEMLTIPRKNRMNRASDQSDHARYRQSTTNSHKRPSKDNRRFSGSGSPGSALVGVAKSGASLATGYLYQTTANLRSLFAGGSQSPQSSNEVVDLCGDDDGSSEQYHEGDSMITEHAEDSSRPSISTQSSVSLTTKQSQSASQQSSRVGAGRSSTTSAPSTSDRDDESSDDELEVTGTPVSSMHFQDPSHAHSTGMSGTSDLFPSNEDDDEDYVPDGDICSTINGIFDEPYAGTLVSSTQKMKKGQSLKETSTSKKARKPTPNRESSMTASAWGNALLSSSSAAKRPKPVSKQSSLKLSKVNAKTKQKGKGTPINIPGSTFMNVSNPITDPICEDSDSDIEVRTGQKRLRRMDATWAGRVQPNPLGTRTSLPRKSKAARKKVVELDESDDESDLDNTTLARLADDKPHPAKRKNLAAVRIAIGKKVFSTKCMFRYKRDKKEGLIVLTYNNGGNRMKHEISLDVTSVREMKYFIVNDDADVPGKPITIDFDESEEMSFLAMQIEPDDKNGLSQFRNAYQPSASKDVSLSSANRRYIAIEFRSDSEFRDLLRTMKMDNTLQAFIDESSRLTSNNAESYGGSLLESARREREARESSLGSPRAPRTRTKKRGAKVSNDIMVVFPFSAEEEKIDEAADGFHEAMQQISLASSRRQDAANGAAALNTSDDDNNKATASADSSDSCEDKQRDPSGKAKSRAHFLTIREEDYDRLQPGEFLNDTLIDFWFQWLNRKEQRADSEVHFFTSHFYSSLAKGGVKAVTSWTAKKNIDIFTKKFIFIPINQSLHWSLCVVVNPGEIMNQVEYSENDVPEEALLPCMFFFDSLKAHRQATITKHIRNWLNSEWKRLKKAKEGEEESPFDRKTMDVYSPRVPYQDNSWDCGVFVCRYGFAVYAIFLRGHDVTYADIGKRGQPFRALITDSDEFDFDGDDIVRIRGNLAILLNKLSILYKEWKKASDEAEKKAEEEAGAKKPAARRLLLQGGDASASPKKDPSISMANEHVHSREGETKGVATKARSPINCSTAMEMETTEPEDDVDMKDANVTADAQNDEMISDSAIPVKREEDQYGIKDMEEDHARETYHEAVRDYGVGDEVMEEVTSI